ncbi:DUF349 domain-containing protein [Tenuifilum thalassicum]|uniref:DUF349 domain-containing protein n=1 Tax=Tenuifilum thalassicum TaxID=2590900 RepID=A0A7D4BAW0_9BACT|nr:DUF349 domain-containing protein [Tenuifilum thalassicum]QKG79700.1 DUF349 domain-containing protein [Tenuifilum thalassicum]
MNTNELNDPKDQNLENVEGTNVSVNNNSSDAVEEPKKESADKVSDEEALTPNHDDINDDEEEDVKPIDLDDESTDDDEDDEHADENEEEDDEPSVDYSNMSKDELVQALKDLIYNRPIQKIRQKVESIKSVFYRKHRAEIDKLKKEFVEGGGDIEQFTLPEDNAELQIKELLKLYRQKRAQYNAQIEEEKQKNLALKQEVIEKIKELVNSTEPVGKIYQEFRELQKQFIEIGPVPQASLNDLWNTYHHHVQAFYDFVKISKELRELDFKKNLESKIKLCEQAEELLLEPNVVAAFKKLQKLHDQWREIGPVPRENQNEIWERFKEATTKINKKHQEHFENLKEQYKKNLEAKKELCEKAEELAAQNPETIKEWNKLSKDLIELQKIWKTIGFATKKENNKIFERFRNACDNFFNKKRDFFKEIKEQQQNNLQLKTELCIQAESMKDSTDWKKTTEDLIDLQKRWKQIGPVPRKYSDEIWKRFRAACDYFFEQKSKHFATVDHSYEKNLKDKEALIAEVEAFEFGENIEDNLKALKEFQRRWMEIGFVPIKHKDEIQKRFRAAIQKHFDKINQLDESNKMLIFKAKLEEAKTNPRQLSKLKKDREKMFNRMRKLENDLIVWENNIGFFAKTKNAEAMINEVKQKIEKAKREIEELSEKIRMIDQLDK